MDLFRNFKVVLHQRAKAQDFQPILIEERMRLLDEIFTGTFLNIRAGLTMAKLGIPTYEVLLIIHHIQFHSLSILAH
jgi:hypothetical protein